MIIMIMLKVHDWIWCQYTPGAGGKLICCLMQLDPTVHAWNQRLETDFKRFVREDLLVDHYQHMKLEPQHPYTMDFYTRQLPFTRGDNLNEDEAQELYEQKNPNYLDLNRIVLPTCKPYIEKWFSGSVVSVLNDDDSLSFLKKRRDLIFYEWDKDNKNTVYLKRFLKKHIAHPHLAKRYAHEEIQTSFEYSSMDDFYREQFYNHPEVKDLRTPPSDSRIKSYVNLSDLWKHGGAVVAKQLNQDLNLDIDLDKAEYMVNKWTNFNKEFLD